MSAATTLTPQKCGACKADAKFLCIGCANTAYCSLECLEKNKRVHGLLCATFKDYQERPDKNYYRGIYFPEHDTKPQFVWLEFDGSRLCMRMVDAVQEKYLGNNSFRSVYFDDDKDLQRQFKHQVEVHHHDNFLYNGSDTNKSLAPLIGSTSAPGWRGPLLAQGCKYGYSEDYLDKVEPEDVESDDEGEIPLIPMDLDTTSLGPIIAHLKFVATCQHLPLVESMVYAMKVSQGYGVDVDAE
ncbi:hypothetical protein N0V90_004847 [Kalmusia sp. IMI 367209]|nr:hypothetical protein N0V90_004847 [Kalmusia sp. IMI 367209]